MSYAGLPRQTIAFLADLQANNARDWFEAHRGDYERYWLAAGLDLVAALSEPVSRLGLSAVPKLNASLRRIHRDVRFSHDKRPYEPRLHLIFTAGNAFNKEPGVHVVIGSAGWGYGAGVYGLSPEALDRYRQAVADPARRDVFQAALSAAASVQSKLDPPELAKLPKGMTADPEWAHLLRRKSVIARTQGDRPLPDWLYTNAAIDHLATIIAAHVPLIRWLAAL